MRKFSKLSFSIFFAIAVSVASTAQVSSKTAGMTSNAAEHAAALAESGGCSEALPLLAKTAAHLTDKELQKRVALDGVRCSTLLKQSGLLLDFVRLLNQQFPHDPEVLYVSVHAYSDLSNAGAEYILGELSRQAGAFPEAIEHYTKATKFDPNFADAYLGLGVSLLTEKKYKGAVPPLEMAVKLQPGNPAGHYTLALPYARTRRPHDRARALALPH